MKIVLDPFGGLGNRMRALDSAFALSALLSARLEVLWPLSPALNCRFEDLFVVPEEMHRLRTVDDGIRGRLRQLTHRLASRAYIDQPHLVQLPNEGFDFATPAGHGTVFIHTCSRFFSGPLPYEQLQPTNALRSCIDELNIEERFVGVHIRRGDNATATLESPVGRFIEAMEREIRSRNDVAFFLATDAVEIEAQLRRRFGERVRCHAKRSLDRNTTEAIQDALIDLYCLARCRKILGSYWSSFSETVAEVSGVPRVAVRRGRR